MEDWEDVPVADFLNKKVLPKGNWDDEDLDENDVKDSWEDEEDNEPPKVPKFESAPPAKAPKKAASKLSDGKGKDVEVVKKDPIEEKLRQQRLVEEADFKTTAELFAKKGDEKTLDNFIPKTMHKILGRKEPR